MAIIVHAPEKWEVPYNTPSIFLAGSIEMGKAIDWQSELTDKIKHLNCTILNPRRHFFNIDEKQSINNPVFKEQVVWELNALEKVDYIALNFLPDTKSPISLLELGLFACGLQRVIVCCPEGFWRKGNVDIVCERYDIEYYDNYDKFTSAVTNRLINWQSHVRTPETTE